MQCNVFLELILVSVAWSDWGPFLWMGMLDHCRFFSWLRDHKRTPGQERPKATDTLPPARFQAWPRLIRSLSFFVDDPGVLVLSLQWYSSKIQLKNHWSFRPMKGPFSQGFEKFSHPKSCRKISNLIITELFNSMIFFTWTEVPFI